MTVNVIGLLVDRVARVIRVLVLVSVRGRSIQETTDKKKKKGKRTGNWRDYFGPSNKARLKFWCSVRHKCANTENVFFFLFECILEEVSKRKTDTLGETD